MPGWRARNDPDPTSEPEEHPVTTHDDDAPHAAATHGTDAVAAHSALEAAGRANASLARRGRWLHTYLLAFAVATATLVVVIGLGGLVGIVIGTSLWGVFLASIIPWALRQDVTPRHLGRRWAWTLGSFAVLYGATLGVGIARFPDEVAFWVPAAVVCAAPFAVAAVSLPPIGFPAATGATGATDSVART